MKVRQPLRGTGRSVDIRHKERGSAYEELLYLPHHVSDVHPRMAMIDRAAQFAPFAALTGYEEAVDECIKRMEEEVENEYGKD